MTAADIPVLAQAFVLGFMAGGVTVLWACYAVGRKKQQAGQAEAPPVAPLQRAPSSPWQWHAMPCGTRLELGATGFYISLQVAEPAWPYHAYSPEHHRMARSTDLAALKRYVEGEALERAEFTAAAAAGWRP